MCVCVCVCHLPAAVPPPPAPFSRGRTKHVVQAPCNAEQADVERDRDRGYETAGLCVVRLSSRNEVAKMRERFGDRVSD